MIQFDTLEALEAATFEDLQGKIVFLSTRMRKTREGKGYGETVVNRSRGSFVAASKGASFFKAFPILNLIDNHSHLHLEWFCQNLENPMYVCICNAVTDSDIRNAVADGVRNLRQLKRATGCSSTCGCCRQEAADVLQHALSEERNTRCLLPVIQLA